MTGDRDKPQRRGADGKFQPGTAAGPGRRGGTREHREALRRACTAEDVQSIVGVLKDLALSGDVGAAKVLLDRLLGRPREEPVALDVPLPDLTSAAAIADGVRMIVRAVAAGELPADQGRMICDLLTSALQIGEVEALLRQCEVPPAWRRN